MGYQQLRKGRYSERNRPYLITTVTNDRRRLFETLEESRVVIRSLAWLHDAGHVESLAYVLMPDHLHWLFSLNNSNLAAVMHSLKGFSANRLSRDFGVDAPVWQNGFHDHGIRREQDLRNLARYVVANPLRAGLVDSIRDYPHWDAVWLDHTLDW
jgi:REP element-mobilizing transposase RayT